MPPAAVGAAMAVGAVAKGISARKAAKKADKRAAENRRKNLLFASPERYLKLLNQYRGAFSDEYSPHLKNIGQALALGEQSANQSIDTDLGRRGLSGSGLGYALKGAQSATRQSNYNQALRDFSSQVESAARGQASGTQQLETGTSLSSPLTYTPRPGWGEIGGEALSSAAGGMAGYQNMTKMPSGFYMGNQPGRG